MMMLIVIMIEVLNQIIPVLLIIKAYLKVYFTIDYCIISCKAVEIGVCTLKEQLILDMDFALLPEPVWNLLIKYYGLSVGSQAIER